MSDLAITDDDVARCVALAAVLLPGTAKMPGVEALDGFGSSIRTAVRACGYTNTAIRSAFDALDPEVDWDWAKAFAASRPAEFRIASTLVSAAYYMMPGVLARLGYPVERQHPANVEDFVTEYETGVLDAVIERGSRYRDVTPGQRRT